MSSKTLASNPGETEGRPVELQGPQKSSPQINCDPHCAIIA